MYELQPSKLVYKNRTFYLREILRKKHIRFSGQFLFLCAKKEHYLPEETSIKKVNLIKNRLRREDINLYSYTYQLNLIITSLCYDIIV